MMTAADVFSMLSVDSRFRNGQGIIVFPKLSGEPRRVLLASTAETILYQTTPGRTSWLIGLFVFNSHTADVLLTISSGTTAAPQDALPVLGPFIVNHHEMVWLPPTEFTTDIIVSSDGGSADPDAVELMPFVVELPGD